MAQRNLSTEKKIMDLGNRFMVSKVEGELGVNRCRLLHLEWITHEILLCSTGNYVGSLMMEHDNVTKKNVYMYV